MVIQRLAVLVSIAALVVVGSAWALPSKAPGPLVVKPGYSRAFARLDLPPGSIVRCVNEGHAISIQIPAPSIAEARFPIISMGTVWTRPGTEHFHLHVVFERRSYLVSCGLGGRPGAPPAVK
jgi:hypothetical protein